MSNLKPCPFRRADDEGHILCDKIKTGDREITPNVCRACPVMQINCAHLRATLDHSSRPPIVVRWSNGKTRVWDDFATEAISLERAACAEKVMPIHSPRDCAGCALRAALISPEGILVARPPVPTNGKPTRASRAPRSAPAPEPIAAALPPLSAPPLPPQPVVQAAPAPTTFAAPTPPPAKVRSRIVAAKIIQLQEWLAKKNTTEKSEEAAQASSDVSTQTPAPRMARVVGEERRVGWTD